MIFQSNPSDALGESQEFVATVMTGLKTIPAIPQAAMRLTRVVGDESATLEEIVSIISSDVSLSARILKVVNSPYYGMSRQIHSVREAVILIGYKAVRHIAVASCFDKLFKADSSFPDFNPRTLWGNSVAVATCCKEIARIHGRVDEDQAFLAGLIRDVGVIVEMQLCAGAFAESLELVASGRCELLRDAEKIAMGATHEEFGAMLCRMWNFPDALESVVKFHHEPMGAPEEHRALVSIVHAADSLVASLPVESVDRNISFPPSVDVMEWVGLDSSDLALLRDSLEPKIDEANELISLGDDED